MRYLKIHSLPSNTYQDRDIIMLHACFQILVDFVEKENGLEYGYEEDRAEMKELYKWWKNRDHEEDEDAANVQLERLIKIRESLWT